MASMVSPMSSASPGLNTSFNPLLSNPPARRATQPEPVEEPVAVPDSPSGPVPTLQPAPKKSTWQASAARPGMQPKKNGGSGAIAAAAAKQLGGQNRLQKMNSASSLQLNNFPLPGQAMASMVQQRSADGLLTPEYEKPNMMDNAPTRSMAHFGPWSTSAPRAGYARSIASTSSGNNKVGNSLGNGVGFTFKGTTNFVHPNRQVPRSYTPSSRSRCTSQRSFGYQEEEEDDADRMNSITSDGGWKSGWSVGNGSNSGLPLEDGTSSADEGGPDTFIDESAPDDVPATILEEIPSTILEEQDDDDLPPSRDASPMRVPLASTDASSNHSDRSGRSLVSRKSSLSICLRAKDNDDSAPTSPVRSSFDRALTKFSTTRSLELEDPTVRRASIAAARRAFEEKEAAKDRKAAERETKQEARRRDSSVHERPLWRRRPSNAVDSAVDSPEEKSATYQVARRVSVARNGSIVRANSISISRPMSAGSDDGVDPASSQAIQQQQQPESALFPAYEATPVAAANSLFSAAYQDDATGLFPPPRTATEAYVEDQRQHAASGGLFPPPQPTPIQAGAIYHIDGKMYDEFGMPIHQVVVPDQRSGNDEDNESVDSRGRRMSKTKQAKGKLNKFSAWGKTRLLRV